MKNRQWLLARRPSGPIQDSDFNFVETDAPTPGAGEVLVRTLMLSCDPTQRRWIAFDTYLPAVKIGEVVRSGGAGRIEMSNNSDFKVGDIVVGLVGWQDYVAMNPKDQLNKLPPGAPLELAMSALSMNGITAYFGLLEVGRPVAGETVVVSGAAGATGSVAGQIAKIKGCHVIGIAGGAEKCRWLTDEAGFDAAIDYKSEDVQARLKELCPKGIDIFFDNVGGDILDAALAQLAMRGRVVLCGAIANYNATDWPPPGPKNYLNLLLKRGRMEGFSVYDYMPRAAEARGALAGWVHAGKIKYLVDVQHGLENAPATLRRLFDGRNEGKQLLRVAE
ncbi:NADP-dependent oxidoreductase [Rhodoblastus sp.]|uniref:NADP-dependent oxidoreductase n=1 Tax=Rhodoblastus sp. TaxID=1962975 RepID=UPI003F99A59B